MLEEELPDDGHGDDRGDDRGVEAQPEERPELGDPTVEGDLTAVLSLGNVMGFAVVAALLNLVVTTALGAIIAVLYNLSVKITGGLLVGFTNN